VINQKPNVPDQKNFILAIVLSMAIIFGWQYFFAAPQLRQAEQQASQQQATQAQVPGTQAAAETVDRQVAINGTVRVPIETAELEGSINLAGAQLDDLKLRNYRETASPASPIITFLSPAGTANGYFAEQGVVGPAGQTAKLPDSKTVWTAPPGAKLGKDTPLVLTWDNGEGLMFRREISISNEYVFTVRQTIDNRSSTPVSVIPYGRVQRQDTPVIAGYYSFFEGLLGVQNSTLQEVHYSDVAEVGGKVANESKGGWLGFTDKYWATALIPDQGRDITATYQHFKTGTRDTYQTDYLAKAPLTIAPGTAGVLEDHVFAGAKIVKTIDAVGARYGIDKFDLMIDWGWFKFLTQPMFYLMEFCNGLIGNFGLAILMVTVIVKLAVFPLANKSYASMSKMKKLQPEMERIKKEAGDDRMKMQQAMMELYKKEKVSPMSGCLPVIVQIPIFFAIYKVILTTIELRHAPFYGWIKDLSAPDPTSLFNLFGLIPWEPPQLLMLGIWPILMGITMWVQMRLNPAPADPIQASMFNWMPLIFTFMLGSMPAGLVIYWTWSNLLSIIQQSYIMKKNGVEVDLVGNIRESLPFLRKKPAT
jgi:YidC/Oxa1 family membrane protein insertase